MIDYKKIKIIISDVDGVWTDAKIFKGNGNEEFKQFTVLDGVGVAMAKIADIKIALVSARFSPATEERAKELKIYDIYNGGLNKLHALEELKLKYNFSNEEISFIGDDYVDIPVMEKVAAPIAVNNAIEDVKKISIYTTKKSGGEGAFREAVFWILEKQERLDLVLNQMRKKILDN